MAQSLPDALAQIDDQRILLQKGMNTLAELARAVTVNDYSAALIFRKLSPDDRLLQVQALQVLEDV